jgi:hypothetical protein
VSLFDVKAILLLSGHRQIQRHKGKTMKLFLAVAITLTSSLSMASTISSMKECTIELYYSNPWKSSYTLKDSRLTGKAAQAKLLSIRPEARSEVTKDVLGVERFVTVIKRTVLDSRGDDINSCTGVSSAVGVEVCTTDSETVVCETFCSLEWNGMDCR